jgi:hypothetical protein
LDFYWIDPIEAAKRFISKPKFAGKSIHSKAIVSNLNLNLTVLCTMASYAAADCHFWQDAHRRMASVIARIRRAEECERGERVQDHQSVNGEKLFMSLSSVECTEVEYATE